MRVLQCPRCELRFELAPLLRDHLERDHGVAPEAVDHLRPPSARPAPPTGGCAPPGGGDGQHPGTG